MTPPAISTKALKISDPVSTREVELQEKKRQLQPQKDDKAKNYRNFFVMRNDFFRIFQQQAWCRGLNTQFLDSSIKAVHTGGA